MLATSEAERAKAGEREGRTGRIGERKGERESDRNTPSREEWSIYIEMSDEAAVEAQLWVRQLDTAA